MPIEIGKSYGQVPRSVWRPARASLNKQKMTLLGVHSPQNLLLELRRKMTLLGVRSLL